MSDTYKRRKAAGVCVRCGVVPPQPGRVSCKACAIKNSEATRDMEAYKKRRAKRLADKGSTMTERELVQHHFDNGLCIRCGRKLVAKRGSSMCMDCRIREESNGSRVGIHIRKGGKS